LTFPNNDQPDMPFAAVGSEGFVSALTGRRIWGYLTFPTSVAMPVTAVSLDNRTVVEFEVGTPPSDPPLSIKADSVGIQISSDPFFESRGRRGEDAPVPLPDTLGPKPFRHLRDSFTHEESIDVPEEPYIINTSEMRLLIRALTICIEHDRDRMLSSFATEGMADKEARILGATMSETESLLHKIEGSVPNE
jgi:hypothetical protein